MLGDVKSPLRRAALTEAQPGLAFSLSKNQDLILSPRAAGHATELCNFWPKYVLGLKIYVVSEALLGRFTEEKHALRAIQCKSLYPFCAELQVGARKANEPSQVCEPRGEGGPFPPLTAQT